MSSLYSGVEVILVVEGPTEQTFVSSVLAPYMAARGVYLRAALIGKPGHKGGNVRWDRAKIDIGNFLKQRPSTHISTMFDYFRIDPSWPGFARLQIYRATGEQLNASQKAAILEAETKKEASTAFAAFDAERRFIPYIEMHEFEALLFSDVDILAEEIGVKSERIVQIVSQYETPEEINENPMFAPSKQLAAISSGYRKVTMGISIVERIGIPQLRTACPHFDQWLRHLESLPRSMDSDMLV
ncbi:MAG: DUF4276 family protein [Caldilineaceae bacterium]|nr:DUF4276 family protein [Caldilineaceae bacterium]MCB0095294.1 DUF4276 family protein [Caldilineaceae bacterium]